MDPAPRMRVTDLPLAGLRVAIVGRLASMSRRDAHKLLRGHGAVPVEASDEDVKLLVVGEAGGGLAAVDELAGAGPAAERLRQAIDSGRVSAWSETQLWQRLGLIEEETAARRLYTPAMLADLVGVPLSVVRRWHRRGLIRPLREVCRLPYFDFQEVVTARKLAALLAAGMSPQTIERQLTALAKLVPNVERPLAQLSIILRDKDLLLRAGGGLVDASGQMYMDFDQPLEDEAADSWPHATLPLAAAFPPAHSEAFTTPMCESPQEMPPLAASAQPPASRGGLLSSDPTAQPAFCPASSASLCQLAMALEDEERLAEAADAYRAAMAAGGPTTEMCFRLAEVLYRMGCLEAACERYYVTLELDEEFVEARANLGCVLAESGRLELAAAAFEGALRFHPDYADAHYHLAQVLNELGRDEEAQTHYRRFLELAPASPWAATARQRVRQPAGEDSG